MRTRHSNSTYKRYPRGSSTGSETTGGQDISVKRGVVRQKIVRIFPKRYEIIPNLNEGWLSLDVGPRNSVNTVSFQALVKNLSRIEPSTTFKRGDSAPEPWLFLGLGESRGRATNLAFGSLFLYYIIMAKSIPVIRKKKGRPATGQDPVMTVRLPPELTERVDAWVKSRDAQSRSDAIRQLIELGLDKPSAKSHQPKKPRRRR
jgi:hypothetical protein